MTHARAFLHNLWAVADFVNGQNVVGFVDGQKNMRFTASGLGASNWLCLGCAVTFSSVNLGLLLPQL